MLDRGKLSDESNHFWHPNKEDELLFLWRTHTMPAAKPSKATISNAIAAATASGFTPTSITVGADGSLTIDLSVLDLSLQANAAPKTKALRKFGEART